jgi:hypothetical protein
MMPAPESENFSTFFFKDEKGVDYVGFAYKHADFTEEEVQFPVVFLGEFIQLLKAVEDEIG